MFDLRRAFNAHVPAGMAKADVREEVGAEPAGEWLTVKQVAAWLNVSEHHVYKKIAKLPGCEPINVGRSDRQPDYRFNRYQLIAALSAPRYR